MIEIDGTIGEGGGQILRSALGLSLVTGTPFRIQNIRAKRKKPGLMRQHLTCVQAATRIGCAKVDGDTIGSTTLTFEPGSRQPGGIEGGNFHFAIGTAGSTSLVLQAVLPALLVARGPSRIVIEGGTHNPWAPPYDFLVHAFLPLLARMGADVQIELERPGFFPAGGGRIAVTVQPIGAGGWKPLHLPERGAPQRREAIAYVANLPESVAKRELKVIGRKLQFESRELLVRELPNSQGPGNMVSIVVASEHVTEVFTGFGELGKPAENVAGEAVHHAKEYLKSDAPVGRYLADQLLLPMAMAGAGSFRALPLSRHTRTNIQVVEMFLPVAVRHDDADRVATVSISTTTRAKS
jgi:RNA 3'-terminal phosphate cyclase (ATP)